MTSFNYKKVKDFCRGRGIKNIITNKGYLWIFKRDKDYLYWWPSSTKVKIKKKKESYLKNNETLFLLLKTYFGKKTMTTTNKTKEKSKTILRKWTDNEKEKVSEKVPHLIGNLLKSTNNEDLKYKFNDEIEKIRHEEKTMETKLDDTIIFDAITMMRSNNILAMTLNSETKDGYNIVVEISKEQSEEEKDNN